MNIKHYNFGLEKIIRDGRTIKEFIPTDPNVWSQFKLDHDFFSEELHQFLKDLGIGYNWIEVFYSPPGWTNVIHTDAGTIRSVGKLNWVVGDTASGIKWYTIKDYTKFEQRQSMLTTKYIKFNETDVEYLTTTRCTGWPSMIDAGILPHQSTNYGGKPRWAICMTMQSKNRPGAMTFNELEEVLRPYEIT